MFYVVKFVLINLTLNSSVCWMINHVWKLCKNQLKYLESNLSTFNKHWNFRMISFCHSYWYLVRTTSGYPNWYNNKLWCILSHRQSLQSKENRRRKSWKHLMINNIPCVPLLKQQIRNLFCPRLNIRDRITTTLATYLIV